MYAKIKRSFNFFGQKLHDNLLSFSDCANYVELCDQKTEGFMSLQIQFGL